MANDDDAPDPARILKLAMQSLTSAERRRKFRSIDFFEPYPPQLKFFADGAKYHQRLIRGGNQTGKSFCCAAELGYHLCGEYPVNWAGRKFNKPIRAWVVGPTAQLVRDGPQRQLCSRQGEYGTGTIPLTALAATGRPIMVPGGSGGIDTLKTTHKTNNVIDGISSCTFKSFEMRSEKMSSRERRRYMGRRALFRGNLFRITRTNDRDRWHRLPELYATQGWRRTHLPLPQRVFA